MRLTVAPLPLAEHADMTKLTAAFAMVLILALGCSEKPLPYGGPPRMAPRRSQSGSGSPRQQHTES